MDGAGKKVMDKADFRIFHQKYVRLFYHLGLKFIDDIEVVRDIVQEAFIAAWQRFDEFENEIHVKAFLYTAIRNRCLNYLRDRQVEQRNREKLWLLQNQENFRETAIENEVYDKLCRKIEMLPPMQQKVLWLHVDGLSNEEIAERLNVTVNTVLTHKQRARAVLREFLGNSSHLFLLVLIPLV